MHVVRDVTTCMCKMQICMHVRVRVRGRRGHLLVDGGEGARDDRREDEHAEGRHHGADERVGAEQLERGALRREEGPVGPTCADERYRDRLHDEEHPLHDAVDAELQWVLGHHAPRAETRHAEAGVLHEDEDVRVARDEPGQGWG